MGDSVEANEQLGGSSDKCSDPAPSAPPEAGESPVGLKCRPLRSSTDENDVRFAEQLQWINNATQTSLLGLNEPANGQANDEGGMYVDQCDDCPSDSWRKQTMKPNQSPIARLAMDPPAMDPSAMDPSAMAPPAMDQQQRSQALDSRPVDRAPRRGQLLHSVSAVVPASYQDSSGYDKRARQPRCLRHEGWQEGKTECRHHNGGQPEVYHRSCTLQPSLQVGSSLRDGMSFWEESSCERPSDFLRTNNWNDVDEKEARSDHAGQEVGRLNAKYAPPPTPRDVDPCMVPKFYLRVWLAVGEILVCCLGTVVALGIIGCPLIVVAILERQRLASLSVQVFTSP
ncbi:putative transmembrane protein [Gregarina niphandrodes]|uniref:Transmembrane protein n=1 Tax=Gregarina niphandrodes TaxID=110365 RepID=A0A023B628_GRENI|nr:putative transmembrane protein [Gregarina niphandrodes]EZG64996.1 putative transmembrane protein [Gregarina niphandrodes]|eukprot:XP_011134115.1 putative transmembrane protein [Gregarina niphandrodes]